MAVEIYNTTTKQWLPWTGDGRGQFSVNNGKTPVGTHANAWSAAVTGVGGTSNIIDNGNGSSSVAVFGNSSGISTLSISVSQDGVNFYATGITIAATAANFFLQTTIGARYIQLTSSVSVTVTATVASLP